MNIHETEIKDSTEVSFRLKYKEFKMNFSYKHPLSITPRRNGIRLRNILNLSLLSACVSFKRLFRLNHLIPDESYIC